MGVVIRLYDKGKWTGEGIILYRGSITHNLIPMWKQAGVYEAIYESEGKQAKRIIKPLKLGLRKMLEEPKEFVKLEPKNGWGDYWGVVNFIANLLEACMKYPKARIWIWR